MDRRKAIMFGMPIWVDGDSAEAQNWFAHCVIEVCLFFQWLMFVALKIECHGWMVMEYEGSYWHGLWVWLTASRHGDE